MTVFDQGLRGHSDDEIAAVCRTERRAIVTLDLDFADIRKFPPKDYAGIIVLRIARPRRTLVTLAIARILSYLEKETLVGCLWMVDDSQVRIWDGN